MALPTLRLIGFIIGIFLITLAIAMVVPMGTLVVFDRTGDLPSFLWASMITFLAGLTLVIPGRPEHVHLRPRDMYLLTVSSWLVVCIFAALPFLLTQHISYTDSFFESMSGITATGATVLTGLDNMSPGILMWRSLLHWIGGIGFIGMAVAILPLLRIGGMRLFQTESSDRSPFAHGGAFDRCGLRRHHHFRQPGVLVGRDESVRRDQPRDVSDFHRWFLDLRPVFGQVAGACSALGRDRHHDSWCPAVHPVCSDLAR